MSDAVDRVPAQVKILPPLRQGERRKQRRFVIDGEVKPEAEEPSSTAEERPLGHSSAEEAGSRLDVTA